MVSIIMHAALAHAGPCGHLFVASAVSGGVSLIQRQNLYVNFEGEDKGVPLSFRMANGEPASEAVNSLFRACEAACSNYEVIEVDGLRKDIRQRAGRPMLLDALVQLPPGERTLMAFAEELRLALENVDQAVNHPLTTVDSSAHPSVRIIVPELSSPILARELLARLSVVPARERDTSQKRVGWLLSGGNDDGSGQVLQLTVVDLTPLPMLSEAEAEAEAEAEPVAISSRVAQIESSINTLKNNPPPFEQAEIQEMLSDYAALLPEAARLDTLAEQRCDP